MDLQRSRFLPRRVRLALARLKKRLPLTAPVRVGIVKIPDEEDALGLIDFVDGKFVIVLDDSLNDRSLCECLAHEWAHALIWDVPNEKDHGSAWGAQYAKSYCVVFRTT